MPPTPVAALSASIDPATVISDSKGNVYFASNNCVFKLDATGAITRVAGSSTIMSYSGDGGAAANAGLAYPAALAFDSAGNLYIADSNNARVRRVTTDGTINPVVGNGTAGLAGDGGPAISASLNTPRGLAFDAAGNLYISDLAAGRIRKVSRDGTITTIAGNGDRLEGAACDYGSGSGDGGPALGAALCQPQGLALDSAGNLYIGSAYAGVVRKVTPAQPKP